MRIVVLAKDKPGLSVAMDFLAPYNPILRIGTRFDPFPEDLFLQSTNVLISYLSPWIVPGQVLKKIKIASVNFHPGPPEYPGTGCTNFALYNQERTFGVTAHIMEEGVDSGRIIKVSRFPVAINETVFSLTNKCYSEIEKIFPSVISPILEGRILTDDTESWARKPYTRKELDELCKISCKMSEVEVKRRIRATVYPGMPGPYIEIYGQRFEFKNE